MRPSRNPVFLTVIFLSALFLTAAAFSLLFYPPHFILEAAAHRALGSQVSWQSVSRSGASLVVEGIEIPAKPFTFRATHARLTHSIFQGIRTGAWSFALQDIQADPNRPPWPSVRFRSGRARWLAKARRLELEEWVSDAARLEAQIQWTAPPGKAKIETMRVAGSANSEELGGVLQVWKPLSGRPAESVAKWRNFELRYKKGALEIEVDSLPFFRAAWKSSNGAF